MKYLEYYIVCIVFGFMLLTVMGTEGPDFLNHQDSDSYFSNAEVYDFSKGKFLIKEEIELCGELKGPGTIVDKNYYNMCKS